tara:strand:+ start:119 stop:898 length:780 start_codon:yes stop_codon:yes gene_type:complete
MLNNNNHILEAKEFSHSFGAVKALTNASLALKKNEVMGLVGDNGAGKSTLLKILSGIIPLSNGKVYIEGKLQNFRSAQDALDAGIETVYQDLALVDSMNAFQNVYLGREEISSNPIAKLLRLVDDKKMREKSKEILESLAVKIPSVNGNVKSMSGGQRQCLAIARALMWKRNIVILDEPTAALGVQETEQVLELIKDLKSHNVSVIVVSHNMQHIMAVCDRVTIMRLGSTIATRDIKNTEISEIVGLITGAILEENKKN